jgi:hypothetical protein
MDKLQSCAVGVGSARSISGCQCICSVEKMEEGSQDASLQYSQL